MGANNSNSMRRFPPLDLGLFAKVAPEEVWFRMKPLQVPADCYRLGEVRTVGELQNWHRTRRVNSEESRRAALPIKNINLLKCKFDAFLCRK
jgi:hypothetical protein